MSRLAAATADTVTVPIAIPREALVHVAAPPDPVSQLSADSVGLSRRRYLELLNEYERAGGVVARRGKLRLVRRDPFVSFLMATAPPADEPAQGGAASVLAELGLGLAGSR